MSGPSNGQLAWSLAILKAPTPISPHRHAEPGRHHRPTLNSEEPAKAPQLVKEYRQVVLQSATDVAAADDTSQKEAAAVDEIERALDG